MRLSYEQKVVVVEATTAGIVPHLNQLNESEQNRFKGMVANTILPVLVVLPDNTTASNLGAHEALIKTIALELIVLEIQSDPDLASYPQEVIRDMIPDQLFETSVGSLKHMLGLALDALGPDEGLVEIENLAENFDAIDVDEEFQKFFE